MAITVAQHTTQTGDGKPVKIQNRDLDCGSMKLEIWPNLTFKSAEFAAFSKTL